MNQTTEGRRPKRRRPDLDTVYSINADGSRNFIQPADVLGKWQVIRNSVNFLLMLVYMGLPWLKIGDKPLVLFSLPDRQAWIFGFSFTNQDFYLMFFVVTAFGFLLFVLTALLGRVWCGYACPQTVFMEGVFRKFERLIEGGRVTRIRRNQGPLNFDKVWRKTVKHVLFIFLSALIA
ncbi:MAG: 4Fe-4S binding protein, partial [Bacteroidetes bacterium]|nr:4Fe-4S binding protein [Bacteroidota bacterium]